MNNNIEYIRRKVNQVKRRLAIKLVIKYAIGGLCTGLIIASILTLSSLMMPVMFLSMKNTIIVGVSILLGASTSLFSIPSSMDVAKKIDEHGLQERTMTALELMEQSNPYSEMVIGDTAHKLQGIKAKDVVHLLPPRKYMIGMLASMIILMITLIIPSPYTDQVKEGEKLHYAKKAVEKEIKKVRKEIADNPYLSDTDKQELHKALTELNKEIRQARNEKDLTKKSDVGRELADFKKNTALDKRFNDITKKLQNHKSTKALGDALANKAYDKAKGEINKLMEELGKMSQEEYDSLLNSLSSQLANLDKEQLEQALNQLSEDMNATANSLNNSQFASANNSSVSNSSSPSNSSSNSGNQGSNGQGNNNGNGNQGSSGQGSGNGQGNGSQGTGQGSGSGNGSGNGTGNGNGNGNGSGNGMGKGRGTGSANSETDGTGVQGTTHDEQLSGSRGNKNSEIQLMREGVSIAGEKVPYDRIIGEYEDKAYESMNSSDIPQGMQEVVKEYFSGLN